MNTEITYRRPPKREASSNLHTWSRQMGGILVCTRMVQHSSCSIPSRLLFQPHPGLAIDPQMRYAPDGMSRKTAWSGFFVYRS